jgi:hypothetical protein
MVGAKEAEVVGCDYNQDLDDEALKPPKHGSFLLSECIFVDSPSHIHTLLCVCVCQ